MPGRAMPGSTDSACLNESIGKHFQMKSRLQTKPSNTVYMDAYIHRQIQRYIQTSMHTYLHRYIHINIRVCVCVYILDKIRSAAN